MSRTRFSARLFHAGPVRARRSIARGPARPKVSRVHRRDRLDDLRLHGRPGLHGARSADGRRLHGEEPIDDGRGRRARRRFTDAASRRRRRRRLVAIVSLQANQRAGRRGGPQPSRRRRGASGSPASARDRSRRRRRVAPQVSTTDSVTPQRTSAAQIGQKGPATNFTLYNVSVPISYTPDLFGGTRRHVESDEAAAEYERFELEATYLALTANVDHRGDQRRLLRGADQGHAGTDRHAAEATRPVAGSVLARRSWSGRCALAEGAALANHRGAAAAAKSRARKIATSSWPISAACRARITTRRSASRGCICRASAADASLAPRASAPRYPRRRGAVARGQRQCRRRHRQHASLRHLVGVGRQSGAGCRAIVRAADDGRELGGQRYRNRLFDGGTLYHKKEAQKAAYDQAADKYRSTVITAFQNVADALVAIKADAALLKAQVEAEKSARASFDISTAQFRGGSTTYTTVLNAEQTLLNASTNRVKAQAARLADTVGAVPGARRRLVEPRRRNHRRRSQTQPRERPQSARRGARRSPEPTAARRTFDDQAHAHSSRPRGRRFRRAQRLREFSRRHDQDDHRRIGESAADRLHDRRARERLAAQADGDRHIPGRQRLGSIARSSRHRREDRLRIRHRGREGPSAARTAQRRRHRQTRGR